MTKPFRIRFFGSQSHNLKSKTCTELSRGSFLPTIENPKSKIQNAMAGIFAIVVAFTMGGARAQAQQSKKIPRIGYLSTLDAAGESFRSDAIRLALRELGYIEGQNIATEYRYAEGKLGRQAELAAELVRLQIDIILVAGGDGTVRAAMNATKTVPIIMVGAGRDPVRAGYVESLAHPGGNLTGITNLSRELGGKRLELLKEAVSKVARVAVLYDATSPAPTREFIINLKAAKQIGLTIPPNVLARADKVIK
jgi:putative ABC transport system substrate-binding protein